MKERIQRLLEGLPEGIDGVLITSEVGRAYFTGMRSSAGTALLLKGAESYFIIDFRYIEKARRVVQDCQVILQGKLFEQLRELCVQHHVKKLAIESDYLTVSDYMRYKKSLPEVALVMETRVNQLMREMRAVKSPLELESIQAAQKITDDAFTHICGYIKAGMTDRQVAGELLDFTYRHGSEGPSFDYIVVSGKNSSMPHGVPTDKIIQPGDFITMDFGCKINGYCSDMTRTVAVGQVSEEQKRVYDIVLKANEAAIRAVREGVPCKAVDAAARELIAKEGYGDCFGHSTGHSVGLEIHESPAFSGLDETLCQPGMVITVEPGIYLDGRFGVRIEDMVCVTKEGCLDLTASTKELLVL